jgi:hypothetical protein
MITMNQEFLKSLQDEYKRLLKEAENSRGLDEEKIPNQLKEIKEKYKKMTGKNIENSLK